MAKTKTTPKEEQSSPLLNREQIQEKLEKVMAELMPALGEKKFKRRMKKAGKLISSGLEKKLKNANGASKDGVKDTAVKA